MTVNRRPELCVGALAVRHEHLLLIQRGTDPGRGLWSLPGGRVELGETLAEAVVRETREETGLDVLCEGLVGWVERLTTSHHFVIMDFAVAVHGGADPEAASDAAQARWVPLWEVSEINLVDGLLDFLADHHVIATL
ncbi:MAG: NUDIX hydrolase [Acidimicrobiales bacterium]